MTAISKYLRSEKDIASNHLKTEEDSIAGLKIILVWTPKPNQSR
jgi:hypothetical protein